MKNTINYVLSTLFITLMIVIIVSIINVFSVINKANSYHQTCIAEIQASNFASAVIQSYEDSSKPFKVEIIDRTLESSDDNLEKTGRIFEVKTTYDIKIPIIGYSLTKTVNGFAR